MTKLSEELKEDENDFNKAYLYRILLVSTSHP